MMTYPLCKPARAVPPGRMSLEAFAAAGGIHPELVRRLACLGVLEPTSDPTGRLWFGRAQLIRLDRARRLRAGLALNYAALGLVLDLLRRIDELEAALRTVPRPERSEPSWTPVSAGELAGHATGAGGNRPDT